MTIEIAHLKSDMEKQMESFNKTIKDKDVRTNAIAKERDEQI